VEHIEVIVRTREWIFANAGRWLDHRDHGTVHRIYEDADAKAVQPVAPVRLAFGYRLITSCPSAGCIPRRPQSDHRAGRHCARPDGPGVAWSPIGAVRLDDHWVWLFVDRGSGFSIAQPCARFLLNDSPYAPLLHSRFTWCADPRQLVCTVASVRLLARAGGEQWMLPCR